jgi:hypothetical protein
MAFGRPSRSPDQSPQNTINSMGVMSFMKRWVAKRSASFMSAATLRFLGIGMSKDEGAMATRPARPSHDELGVVRRAVVDGVAPRR